MNAQTRTPKTPKARREKATTLRLLILGVLGVLAWAFIGRWELWNCGVEARQDLPRFKGGIDVVQFTVTVLDKDRRPITGLTAADFEVLVDGKPRPLAAFAAVTLPQESSPASPAASAVASVAPDVQTNQLPAEGRLVVIVMDRSVTNGDPMRAAQAIANAAIDRLGPADLAGVVYTYAGSRKFSQGLTADRARLRAAVNEMTVGALEEPPAPPSVAEVAAGRGAMPPPRPQRRVQLASDEVSGECRCGVCVPDTLTALAKTLTGASARHKTILFVGSDMALAAPDASGYCATYIYSARDRLTRALDEANVTFHVVDPRGLEPLGDSAESAAPAGRDDASTNLLRQRILEILPDYTGGRTVLNSNAPEKAIGPIFDEDHAYYVLAIARDAAEARTDDRRRITIAVKRRDVTVRTRNLYFAADAANRKPAPNAAAAALGELLPSADFPVQMNLVPQFVQDGSSEVRVLLGVDAAVAGKLDVLIRSYDRVFSPVGTPLKQRLDVPASAVAGSAAFQWVSTLKLPPGDYEVRAAVATADGKRNASVFGYVEVPDVRKAELALSGIVLKSGGTPTLLREFPASSAVGFSFQVARAKDAPAASVRYALRDRDGQVVASIPVPHERAVAVGSGIESYDIGVRLPSTAGRYVATIEVSDGRRSARRDVPITVR